MLYRSFHENCTRISSSLHPHDTLIEIESIYKPCWKEGSSWDPWDSPAWMRPAWDSPLPRLCINNVRSKWVGWGGDFPMVQVPIGCAGDFPVKLPLVTLVLIVILINLLVLQAGTLSEAYPDFSGWILINFSLHLPKKIYAGVENSK